MLELHFLPLGRVDAILIGCDGHWAFVDSGYKKDGKASVEYMHKLGIQKLDAYIPSHRHRNHIGGAPYIISTMEPEHIYTADYRMEERLKDLATKDEKKVISSYFYPFCPMLSLDNYFYLGGARFTRIGPTTIQKCSSGALAENKNSMILRVDYGKRSVLLTGDTSASILGQCSDIFLDVEVLKNPHHNGALGKKILNRIEPQHVVICNGKPPASYYRRRVKDIGADMYTAGKKGDGLVIFRGNADGWDITAGGEM